MIALDTNLLVHAHRAGVPDGAARAAIERAPRDPGGWGIALPSVLEFWSVVSHPRADPPSLPREAREFLEALVAAGAQIWVPTVTAPTRLLRLAEDLGASGPRVFDLAVAVIALDHGATDLWTRDACFLTVPGLRTVDPLA